MLNIYQINQKIIHAKSAEEVLEVCNKHLADFDHINVATAFNRLGKLINRKTIITIVNS